MEQIQVYDNMTKRELQRLMIYRNFTNIAQYSNKMQIIEALELKDKETNPNYVQKVSPYARMTIEELKEQMSERNMDRIFQYKTKFQMVRALELDDKNGTPVSKVQLIVRKVAPSV